MNGAQAHCAIRRFESGRPTRGWILNSSGPAIFEYGELDTCSHHTATCSRHAEDAKPPVLANYAIDPPLFRSQLSFMQKERSTQSETSSGRWEVPPATPRMVIARDEVKRLVEGRRERDSAMARRVRQAELRYDTTYALQKTTKVRVTLSACWNCVTC